jgi:hypothetical protein
MYSMPTFKGTRPVSSFEGIINGACPWLYVVVSYRLACSAERNQWALLSLPRTCVRSPRDGSYLDAGD